MDGFVTIGTKLDTKSFDAQIDYVEGQLQDIEDKLKRADMGFEVGDTQKLESQYEQLSQKVTTLRKKQADLNKVDLSNVSKSINNAGNSTSNVIKKLGKWVLAIFAIESAYGMVRRSITMLSQANEQIKTDIDYISFAMATAMKPIVEWIINAAYKLLGFINSILVRLFNINIFSQATRENFDKANKSANKLKKTLAGFDEVNTVSSDGSTSVTPKIDLSKMTEQGDGIIAWFTELFKKVNEFWTWDNIISMDLSKFGILETTIKGVLLVIGGLWNVVSGFFMFIKGIIDIIVGLITGNTELIKQGILGAIEGIINIFEGLFELVVGGAMAMFGVLMDIGKAITNGIYEFVIKPIFNFFKGLWDGIVTGASIAWREIKQIFSVVGSFFSGIFTSIKNIFINIAQTVGNVIGSAFKIAINAVLSVADTILNTPIRAINGLIDVINKVPGINLGKLTEIRLPRLKSGGIINQPGRGIPIGNSAIGGESGAEGVIPLTDSQAMETLGSAIGKYITINATINTNMNGRTISKELQKININDSFTLNG